LHISFPCVIDDSTTLSLAQTGTFKGPEDIQEYVNFAFSNFLFDFIERSKDTILTPIRLLGDECSILSTSTSRQQVKATNYSYDRVIAYALHYSTKPFRVKQINLYFPEVFLAQLFGVAFGEILLLFYY
jgi:hypothetical protein